MTFSAFGAPFDNLCGEGDGGRGVVLCQVMLCCVRLCCVVLRCVVLCLRPPGSSRDLLRAAEPPHLQTLSTGIHQANV